MTSWYNQSINLKVMKFVSEPDRELADLLNNNQIISEIKKANPKIIEYFKDQVELLYRALDVLVVMPGDGDSDQRKFRFPLLACELFEENEILIKIMQEHDADRFFSRFLSIVDDIAACQSSESILPCYFARVFESLCKPWMHDTLVSYLIKNVPIILKLVERSTNESMAKCIKALCLADEKYTYGQKIQGDWLQFKKDLINCMFSKATEKNNEPLLMNVIELFTDLVDRNLFIYHKHDLFNALFEAPKVEVYLRLSLDTRCPLTQILALKLVSEALTHLSKVTNKQVLEASEHFINQLVAAAPRYIELLTSPNQVSLEIVQIMISSIRLRQVHPKFINLCQPTALQKLMSIVYAYPNSNIFHTKVERLIGQIFSQFCQDLIDHLFGNMNIVGMTAGKLDLAELNRVGYFGYIIKIAKHYTSIKDEKLITPTMTKAILANTETWTKFSTSVLVPYLGKCSKELGSYDVPEIEPGPDYFTTRSFVPPKNEEEILDDTVRFKAQEAALCEQAPAALLHLDFMQPEDTPSYASDPKKDSHQAIRVDFDEPKVQEQPICVTEEKEVVAEAKTEPENVGSTYQEFMQRRMKMLSTGNSSASKTPTKQASSTTRSRSNSSKKRTTNKWQQQTGDQESTTAKSNQNSPKKSKVVKTDVVQANQALETPPKKIATQKKDIPKIQIYRHNMHPKPDASRARKICPQRDSKLNEILNLLQIRIQA